VNVSVRNAREQMGNVSIRNALKEVTASIASKDVFERYASKHMVVCVAPKNVIVKNMRNACALMRLK
jgi:uncharacterized protein YcfJ